MSKDYYLGLDIGTDSVGWAVTDTEYNIPKFRGNAMWGIRLFEESHGADERRLARSARRRTQRKRERLNLLEMLFDGEVSRIDNTFFMRLRESNLYLEDKTTGSKYAVFADKDYTDKDFHKQYPTIHHLRSELIHNAEPHDVRLVFIALHHIIKNRGHFLFENLEADGIKDFSLVYEELKNYLTDNYEIELNCPDPYEFSNILKDKGLSITKKKSELSELFGVTSKSNTQLYSCLALLSGASVKLCDIFDDETLKDVEKKSISFGSEIEESAYLDVLGERFELIEKLKAVYDWAVLADILLGADYISDAKVEVYKKHQNDLRGLKNYVKKYCPEKYNLVFKDNKDKLCNYVAYSGHVKKNGKTDVLNYKCNQLDFCSFLKKTLGDCQDDKYVGMFNSIQLGTFMPKQVSSNNGVIPMQIHRAELMAILDNARVYLPFLNEKDKDGKSVYEKIIAIFDYRIPYYVGPLNNNSKKYWIVRGEGKIYPWNIDEIVDFDKTAESFIENLTSKCTYLPEYDVIPKSSLLYSKFTVLNELNNLKINGEPIDVSLKQDIYNDLFMKYSKVTAKRLKDYLKSVKGIEVFDISGIDGDFKSGLKSAIELSAYNIAENEKEEIIKAVTIFGDDKGLLKKRIRKVFAGKLTEEELLRLFKLKYKDWSRLSKEFLTDVQVVSKSTGEITNIITELWQTNNNLMKLLYSNDYLPTFEEKVKSLNSFDGDKSLKEIVDDLYVSPGVKRPIYQSLLIAKEIVKTQKCEPEKIFIEVTRGEGEKERKESRKNALLKQYEAIKKDERELYEKLCNENESDLRQDKLYLYYSQCGKCMYTGEPIDFGNLMSGNSNYDIDHIYPRSKIKDDSISNRVLVKKVVNAGKTDVYPIDEAVRQKMYPFWKGLCEKGLISKEKFARLTRNIPLSDDELSAFINRQIVETSQSVKAVAGVLAGLYPKTEIVFVKARLVSEFRHKFDILKCREVNDYHHAKDAYLNVVVGNVYNQLFNHNRDVFIKKLQSSGKDSASMNKIFEYNVDNAWVTENDKSISTVKNTVKKNNILYTRYAFRQHGALFDLMPVKKGKGQTPLKANGAVSQMEKYGAYNSVSSAFYTCVEHTKKNKVLRSLYVVELMDKGDYEKNPVEYLQRKYKIENVKIIAPEIKIQSCVAINGFRMHVGGKSSGGAQIIYRPAVQLVMNYEDEKYIRNIEKYLTSAKLSGRKIDDFDDITVSENAALYSKLCAKMTDTVYKEVFLSLGEQLKEAKVKFEKLSLEEQCVVLDNILKILHNNAVTGDLTKVEIKNSGKIILNNDISNIKNIESFNLINQSVTGLYQNEIDLLK
ncbi:MAG: type II CRISPR RNA-guided endonuclease Cas9 [Acutalibacteraceae bacterium]